MRIPGRLRRIVAAAGAAALLAGCAAEGGPPTTSAVRPASEQRQGDQAHEQILAQFGGAYRDPELQRYIDRVGRRVAAVSEQPDARWTFTVLDNPTVNAFAIPGGYVYVTRGMLALADDEAEIAGVLGHEIGHVTAGHSSLRQGRTTAASAGLLLGSLGLAALGIDPQLAGGVLQAAAGGALASYSRQDELDADLLGIRYLAQAGYDPFAQADILDSLAASSAVEARTAGRGYDPNRVDFFATHPATGPRTRRAVEIAREKGEIARDGERGRERFLAAIDGMVWGPSPEQGFVEGARFIHPELDFAFDAPRGFRLTNTPTAVIAEGPQGARLILDGGGEAPRSLTDHIAREWVPALARQTRVGQLRGPERITINGMDAARAVLPVLSGNREYDALLVAVRHRGKVYRFTGLAPRGSAGLGPLAAATETFRQLDAAERAASRPRRIEVVTVGPGDTAETLAARMRVDQLPLERFLVLNDLERGARLEPGRQVKLIR